MLDKYGFEQKDWEDMLRVFRSFPELEKVILFGSRALNTFKAGSDVDIALVPSKESPHLTAAVKGALEETQLPYFFDVVDYSKLSTPEFKEHIDRHGKEVYGRKNRVYRLGEIATINKKSIDRSYPNIEILYLDTGSITEGRIEKMQKISLKDAPSRAKRLVENQDIVFSTVRPNQKHYGFISTPEVNLVVSTGFSVLSVRKELAEPKYIYYWLTRDVVTNQLQVIAEHNTSTYPALNPSDLERLEIILPSLHEQRRVAGILSNLDNKILLLHEQNQTLEKWAQLLFREWFVKQKPVALTQLGSLVSVKRGGSPRPIHDYISAQGELFWLKISDATATQGPYILRIQDKIRIEGLSKTVKLPVGSIVLSNSATPGIPKILATETCIHDGWLYFPESKLSVNFLYLLFKDIRPELVQLGNGSVFNNLKTETLKNFPVTVGSLEEREKFARVIDPIFEKIYSNSLQAYSLDQLKNTLLESTFNS